MPGTRIPHAFLALLFRQLPALSLTFDEIPLSQGMINDSKFNCIREYLTGCVIHKCHR